VNFYTMRAKLSNVFAHENFVLVVFKDDELGDAFQEQYYSGSQFLFYEFCY
jgi:hypothetical protein